MQKSTKEAGGKHTNEHSVGSLKKINKTDKAFIPQATVTRYVLSKLIVK